MGVGVWVCGGGGGGSRGVCSRVGGDRGGDQSGDQSELPLTLKKSES